MQQPEVPVGIPVELCCGNRITAIEQHRMRWERNGRVIVERDFFGAEHVLLRSIIALRLAIEKHRSQKADDRCIEDDDELYAALGDGIRCDRRVGCKDAMLKNCERFISQRCEGGGPWPSYADLEAENKELRRLVDEGRPFRIG